MRKLLFLSLFIAGIIPALAQKPYFQQDVRYEIRVALDDRLHMLHASEKLHYKNNSPDTLTFLYIHLWPNAYKNDNTALARQLRENGETPFHYS